MARPSEIPPKAIARLQAVTRQRDEIPSDYELEQELGIPAEYIRVLMYRMRKRFKKTTPGETAAEPIQQETAVCVGNSP